MKIRNNNNSIIVKTDTLGLLLIYQNVTAVQHEQLKQEIYNDLGDVIVDIFYEWKMTSVFFVRTIDDSNELADDLQAVMHEISADYNYAAVLQQTIIHNSLEGIYLTSDGTGEISLSKQSGLLLMIELESCIKRGEGA